MRKIIQISLTVLPLSLCAQPAMTEADMQRMMEQAQKAQACMADVDQSAVMAMSEKAQAMEREVKALCQAGKRDEAMQQAMAFGMQVAASKEMQAIRRCGEMMRGMMPKIGMPTVEEMKERHICDGY